MINKIFITLLFLPTLIFGQIPKDCSSCTSVLIESNEIVDLEIYKLRLLKNEIYARKGYVFSNKEFKDYFGKLSWYKPLTNNKLVKLSGIETKNVEIISQRISEISQFISVEENSKYLTEKCLFVRQMIL